MVESLFYSYYIIINTVKTKSRNKINSKTLDALLRIKCLLISTEKCCKTFSPTKPMYDKFKSEIMYKSEQCSNELFDDDNTI